MTSSGRSMSSSFAAKGPSSCTLWASRCLMLTVMGIKSSDAFVSFAAQPGGERCLDVRGHKIMNVSPQTRDFLNDPRAEEGVRVLGHHKNRLNAFIQLTIHQGELKFKLEVRNGAQATNYRLGAAAAGVLDQQTIEGISLNIP